MRPLALLIFGSVVGRAVLAQDLPIMRRLLILTPAFIDSAEVRGVRERQRQLPSKVLRRWKM